MKHDLGNRVLAFIIDSIIVGVITSIIQMIFSIRAGNFVFVGVNLQIGADDLFSILVFALYYLYFATQHEGITFGKQAMRLEVRYTNGAKLTKQKLIERELLKAVLMPISVISFLFVILRSDDKSIHDIVMDTLVYTSDSLDHQEPDKFDQNDEDDPFDNYYK